MDPILLTLLDDFDSTVRVLRSGYLFIEIKVQAKQSVRFGKGRAFPDKKKVSYVKSLVKEFKKQYLGNVKIAGLVRVTILYCFPWTKKDIAYAPLGWILTGVGSDLDNLTKPAMDSLRKLCFKDDAQVVELRARKVRFKVPGVAIRIDEVTPQR